MEDKRNKVLLKNTVLLYIRMFFLMIVTLYTSRMLLSYLGVTDYGVFNLVSGIATFFTCISGSLGGASNRFITYALGLGDSKYFRDVFSTSLNIHVAISVIIFILAETLGLYFFYEKLIIPPERVELSFWVYQYSVFSVISLFYGLPFLSVIIAYEKISIYAYISIIDVLLRLLAVVSLRWVSCDYSVCYAFMLFLIQLIVQFVYQIYCSRVLYCKYKFCLNKSLIRQMFSYTSWIFCGTLSTGLYNQGLNIVLNIFFGPIVNAAVGISTQVQTAVLKLSQNFQTALRPQIVLAFAKKESDRLNNLIYSGTKMCFGLMYIIVLPLCMETKFILNLWLGTIPPQTDVFVILFLIICMIQTLNSPAVIAMQATGDIKKFQIWQFLYLSAIPIGYILLKFFMAPSYSVFIIGVLIEILLFIINLKIIIGKLHIRFSDCFYHSLYPIIKCVLVSAPVSIVFKIIFDGSDVYSFLIVSSVCIISIGFAFYMIVLEKNERNLVKNIIRKLLPKF